MMVAQETVAVLGGTFDPVHFGHLTVAEQVRERTGLDRILFLLSAVPPHKRGTVRTAPHHRAAMLRAALEKRQGVEICYLELVAGGVSYTIDSLRRLRRRGLVPVLVVGEDSLSELPTWREHTALIGEFDLIVADRTRGPAGSSAQARLRSVVDPPSDEAGPGWWREAELGKGGRIFRLCMPPVPISSSTIRSRVARRLDLGGLVPPPVARYIQANRLYLQEESR